MKIEETFRVKYEDTEEQTEMTFIKEKNEDLKIEETFRVKHEDTEVQTGWFSFSKLNYFVLYIFLIHLPLAGVFVHFLPSCSFLAFLF